MNPLIWKKVIEVYHVDSTLKRGVQHFQAEFYEFTLRQTNEFDQSGIR